MTAKKTKPDLPALPALTEMDLDTNRTVTINLHVRVPGRTGELVLGHVMRMPTAEDRLKYFGRIGRNEVALRNLALSEDRTLERARDLTAMAAAVEMYDLLAERTEGPYTFPRGVDWKTVVPPEHKSWVINMLLATAGVLSGFEVKN